MENFSFKLWVDQAEKQEREKIGKRKLQIALHFLYKTLWVWTSNKFIFKTSFICHTVEKIFMGKYGPYSPNTWGLCQNELVVTCKNWSLTKFQCRDCCSNTGSNSWPWRRTLMSSLSLSFPPYSVWCLLDSMTHFFFFFLHLNISEIRMFYNAWHLLVIFVSIFYLFVAHKIILNLTLDIILDSMNRIYMKHILLFLFLLYFPSGTPTPKFLLKFTSKPHTKEWL